MALAAIAVVALIASIGGGSDGDARRAQPGRRRHGARRGTDVLPDGGLFKIPDEVDSAKAGSRRRRLRAQDASRRVRDHLGPSDPPVRLPVEPTDLGEGTIPFPRPDGAYSESPDVEQLRPRPSSTAA